VSRKADASDENHGDDGFHSVLLLPARLTGETVCGRRFRHYLHGGIDNNQVKS
jgi:hypothetical protein